MVQWSHLKPLHFILWFIAISSATWFCTDNLSAILLRSMSHSRILMWITIWALMLNIRCVWQIPSSNHLVDSFYMGKSPIIQVTLLQSSSRFSNKKRYILLLKIISPEVWDCLSELQCTRLYYICEAHLRTFFEDSGYHFQQMNFIFSHLPHH